MMRRMWVCAVLSGWMVLVGSGCKTWQERYPDLAKRVKSAESQVEATRRNTEAVDRKIDQMGGKIVTRVDGLEVKSNQLTTQVKSLNTALTATRTDLGKAVQDQAALRGEQGKFREDVSGRFSTLDKSVASLGANVAGTRTQVVKLNARAARIESDINALKKIAAEIHDIRQGVVKVFNVMDASLGARSKRMERELRALERERDSIKKLSDSITAPVVPKVGPAPKTKAGKKPSAAKAKAR